MTKIEDQIQDVIESKIDHWLKRYGARYLLPFIGDVTIDYAVLKDGIDFDNDGSLFMKLNGTFLDGDQPVHHNIPLITMDNKANKKFNI